MSVKAAPAGEFASRAPVVIVGAGAAGLCAALAAHERGAEIVVLERDALPRGSTALSAGLIPAAGTRFQKALGISDDPALFASDLRRKGHGEVDAAIVQRVAREAGAAVEWLADRYGFPFSVVDDFDYPGHSARRMHGLPSRTGAELIDRLRQAAEDAGLALIVNATVTALYADAGRAIAGVEITRPDGTRDSIGCQALILACNGYGGAADLVARHIPEMRGAYYFGHPGNRGDAVLWGEALGAELLYMSGYQGHGSVAHPHGVLITWAAIMEGGFQVNIKGARFSDESRGYSEQAAVVLAQPEGIAFDIFDERIAAVARQFADFRQAEACGAVIEAANLAQLATRLNLPRATLAESLAEVEEAKRVGGKDRFGRCFAGRQPLSPPFKAVRVTGALFHSQGGLAIDGEGRVLRRQGERLPNLFAAGGAAAGVSGSLASGYLSGNGLLTATVLGRIAGQSAADLTNIAADGPVRRVPYLCDKRSFKEAAAMKRSTDRILTTHSGSLSRPADLIGLNRARAQGEKVDDGAYARCLAAAVADVVRKQCEVGVDIPDDGEFGKPMAANYDYGVWWNYAFARMQGFVPADSVPESQHKKSSVAEMALTTMTNRRDWQKFSEFYQDPESTGTLLGSAARRRTRRPVCTAPIKYSGHAAIAADIANLKKAMAAAGVEEGFMCSIGPGSFARGEDLHYKTEEEFVFAAAEAMREEYKAIVEAGIILQIDDPSLPDNWDMINPEPPLEEFKKFEQARIEALNHALRGLPQDRIRFHICWGSWHGPHTTDIPLQDIVDLVLSVNAGAYSVEAGNVRHEHEWRVWKDVKLPDGKLLIPGVVSHATNIVEHPQVVADRIVRYANVVGRENVIAGSDCGFGGRIHPQIAWAKLEALAEGAKLASRELWR